MAQRGVHDAADPVVITGLGITCSIGADAPTFWSSLLAGRSGARTLERFVEEGLPVTFACELEDFAPGEILGAKTARRMDRFSQLSAVAAMEALGDAGIGSVPDPSRAAIVMGTAIGGSHTIFGEGLRHFQGKTMNPLAIPMLMPNAAAANIGMQLGWTGPTLCVATACAAGANAIGEARQLLLDDRADVVVAGGAEAPNVPLTVQCFANLKAMSMRNDDPASASRPFDVDRDGFVIGEGAGVVVLERLGRARARGARVHAVLSGYGCNADAYHLVQPSPHGEGARACMALALRDAGLDPADVAHISAHGTSTPFNDAGEAEAVLALFGDAPPPVTSVKGATGHMIGGSGAVEAVAACLSLRDGVIPPTANLHTLDPTLGIDVVAGEPRAFTPGPILSNSFAFGGHNVSLVLEPPPADAGA